MKFENVTVARHDPRKRDEASLIFDFKSCLRDIIPILDFQKYLRDITPVYAAAAAMIPMDGDSNYAKQVERRGEEGRGEPLNSELADSPLSVHQGLTYNRYIVSSIIIYI